MGYKSSQPWLDKAKALIEEVEAWQRDPDAMRIATEPLPSEPDDGMVAVLLTNEGLIQ